MSPVFGEKIKVTVFGQSHSEAIGVVIDGLPAGIDIDFDKLAEFMARRAPGQNSYSTPRKEADKVKILSGILNNKTCGAPLCAMIENTNTRSQDYNNLLEVPRPSHADYAAHIKYNGFNDIRGGGHFSGRLTAPLCIAGGIAKQILEEEKNITVDAKILEIGGIKNNSENFISDEILEAIEEVRLQGDSLGGIIECTVNGVPAGIGDTMSGSLESKLSSAIFAIPAIKGIEFGNGFECTTLKGSQNNDPFYFDGDTVKTKTNNHGGILGGISSGMPIVFRVAVKPTPSISIEQDSVNLKTKENVKLSIKGRHDPCIVPRAVPCIEAVAAMTILEEIL